MSRILIVDTDRDLIAATRGILQRGGYSVETAADGEEALQLCAADLPDILVTEALLPKLGGLDLAKKIRELPNGGLVSILLMSAIFSAAKHQKQVKEAQVDDVLQKPFAPQDLLDKIESLEVRLRARETALPTMADEPFPFSGSLARVPFIRLVFELNQGKATGTLRLQKATSKKLVTFENGEPKFVVSNLEQECLGQILVKKGRLTAEECRKSLEIMGQSKKRQGETLMQMGLIEPWELEEALKQQAREKFCEIFAWKEGDYLFVPGRVFKKDLTPVDLSIPQLCLRGAKEHYAMATVQSELGPFLTATPFLLPQSLFTIEDFKFATWDTRIVQQIRRGKSIRDILAMHVARDIDVLQLFFTLYSLRVIDFRRPERAEAPRAKPRPVLPSSPFDLLGVPAGADDKEIQKAFEEKVSRLNEGERQDDYLTALRNAFEKLATQQGRRDYLLRTYEDGGTLIDGAREIFKPEELLAIGRKFFEKKEYDRARRVCQDGVAWFPEEGLFLSYLGFDVFREAAGAEKPSENEPKEKERAFKAMIKAIRLSPDSEEAHFLLGRAFSLDKNYENAIAEFQKTLELAPKHREAAAELHLAQMRLEKKQNTSFMKWKR